MLITRKAIKHMLAEYDERRRIYHMMMSARSVGKMPRYPIVHVRSDFDVKLRGGDVDGDIPSSVQMLRMMEEQRRLDRQNQMHRKIMDMDTRKLGRESAALYAQQPGRGVRA